MYVAIIQNLPCQHDNYEVHERNFDSPLYQRCWQCVDCGFIWQPDWINFSALRAVFNGFIRADIANEAIYFNA